VYTGSPYPDWAAGPFTRVPQNPLLTPQGTGFEQDDVYNPGVLYRNGMTQMLYRGQNNTTGLSEIGYAYSTDGISFTRYPGNPVIVPVGAGEIYGVQDPRLYELNGTYYTFFTGARAGGPDLHEATSTDLIHWNDLGPLFLLRKNGAVLTDPSGTPVKINGQYVMYYGEHDEGAWIAYSTDMIHWTNPTAVNMNFPASYSPWEVCVVVTNYQTLQAGPINNNVLMFVAGTLMAQGRWYYAISEVEFSGTNLTQQLAQLPFAVIAPTAPYELTGQTNNTVYMNTIGFHNGNWYLYYGAADHVTALATAPLR
jgi:predicted GH43/DUF377 family glycosyl hydrolase